MIRALWTAVSVIAIANLLAILGFVGWLSGSGRLSRERVDAVRELFSTSVAAQEAQVEQAKADEQVAQQAADEAAKVGTPPVTAEQKIDRAAERDEQASQHAQRVQRETADLIRTLLQEREQLDAQRAEHQKQVAEFKAMRERIAKEEGSEQFAKAVELYKALKPEQSKSMMSSLISAGQREQVISYLNALPTRTSSKIIAEFQKTDAALAADLLEGLRTLGNAVAQSGEPVTPEPPEE